MEKLRGFHVEGTDDVAADDSATVATDGAVPEATGDAGLYVATETIADVETVGRWIVLEDGSQRGQWCIVIYVDGWPQNWICFGTSKN